MDNKIDLINNPEDIANFLGLKNYDVGNTINSNPHTIFVNLPTLESIISYEEKDINVIQKMQSGYPRFFNPNYTRKLEEYLLKNYKKNDYNKFGLRLVTSKKRANELIQYVNKFCENNYLEVHEYKNDIQIIIFNKESFEVEKKINEFLQHTGCMIYSREAESYLIKENIITNEFEVEKKTSGTYEYLENEICNLLCDELSLKNNKSIFLTKSGMSGLYALFNAVKKIQKRKIWIQLGWLYTDTIELFKKFLSFEDEFIYIKNDYKNGKDDLDLLSNYLENKGFEVSAIIMEAPTNPILYTMDLQKIKNLCDKYKIVLIIDPSMVGIMNVNVLQYSSAVAFSLTKYHSWAGDIIMGACALNPNNHFYNLLLNEIEYFIDKPFIQDLARMVFLLKSYKQINEKINLNTIEFVNFLSKQKNIKKIFWPKSETSKKNFELIAKSETSCGGVVSFELENISLNTFYNKIEIPKGPSFGLVFSLLSPYMYLAHYDLVSTKKGIRLLKENLIPPELLRFSIGIENIDEICTRFEKALN